MTQIKLLSEKTINKIAAGEVIERPVSVVKELVENAIDAKSKNITVEMENGGRNLIKVTDDGTGIAKDQLSIAVERHATSKLNEDDINNISYLGFRGEALPSIGAVSKLRIISRTHSSDTAWEISVNGGEKSNIVPAARQHGTTVEVRDIFCFIPARLKFLKSDASEKTAAVELIQRLAIANPKVAFKLIFDKKIIIDFKATEGIEQRVQEVLNNEFIVNAVKIEYHIHNIKVWGYAGLPTYNHRSVIYQYCYVNSRHIKDKLISSAVKAAYINLIPEGRYPAVVMFIDINPYEVDVNVHPTKTEVRFRDPQLIRNNIVNAIRNNLKRTVVDHNAIHAYRNPTNVSNENAKGSKISIVSNCIPTTNYERKGSEAFSYELNESRASDYIALPSDVNSNVNIAFNSILKGENIKEEKRNQQEVLIDTQLQNFALGIAKFQINDTYIVAQAHNYMIIVDQHAAHERLVLEKMKEQLQQEGQVRRQLLLIPEVIDLGQLLTEKILEHKEELEGFGFKVERNGISQVVVSETPLVLAITPVQEIIKAIAELAAEMGAEETFIAQRDRILGNIACHYSIRAGRKLNVDEMNALLREIENTDFAAQCNHGRPTYIKFTLPDLERLFERR